MSRIKVEVFGVKDKIPLTGRDSCSSPQTMKEMYDEFLNQMKLNPNYMDIEIEFVDYFDDMEGYEHIQAALESGFHLPLTAINDRVRFHNSVPYSKIARIIDRLINR